MGVTFHLNEYHIDPRCSHVEHTHDALRVMVRDGGRRRVLFDGACKSADDGGVCACILCRLMRCDDVLGGFCAGFFRGLGVVARAGTGTGARSPSARARGVALAGLAGRVACLAAGERAVR